MVALGMRRKRADFNSSKNSQPLNTRRMQFQRSHIQFTSSSGLAKVWLSGFCRFESLQDIGGNLGFGVATPCQAVTGPFSSHFDLGLGGLGVRPGKELVSEVAMMYTFQCGNEVLGHTTRSREPKQKDPMLGRLETLEAFWSRDAQGACRSSGDFPMSLARLWQSKHSSACLTAIDTLWDFVVSCCIQVCLVFWDLCRQAASRENACAVYRIAHARAWSLG